jgi:hypothetical protein
MKKILTLLMLSPILFAERTNLSCETYSTFDLIDMSTSETTGSISLVIDTEEKNVTMDNNKSASYKKMGSQIFWYKRQQTQIGDEFSILREYYLDRVTGELETHFKLQKHNNGYTADDSLDWYNKANYETSLIHSSKCSKVEALF